MSLLAGTTLTAQLTNRDAALADQGVAYVAITAAPGTGVAGFATSTTLAIGELNPDFLIVNPGPLNVYPLYLRLHETVVSTGSGTDKFTQFIDVSVSRVASTSTGTALTVSNCNPGSVNQSQAIITVGTNVLNAATSKRRFIAHAFLRATIDVVHDIYQFNWGSPGPTISNPIVGTVMEFVKNYQPVCIPPGYLFGITHWDAGQSAAATYEYEFGYIEK